MSNAWRSTYDFSRDILISITQHTKVDCSRLDPDWLAGLIGISTNPASNILNPTAWSVGDIRCLLRPSSPHTHTHHPHFMEPHRYHVIGKQTIVIGSTPVILVRG